MYLVQNWQSKVITFVQLGAKVITFDYLWTKVITFASGFLAADLEFVVTVFVKSTYRQRSGKLLLSLFPTGGCDTSTVHVTRSTTFFFVPNRIMKSNVQQWLYLLAPLVVKGFAPPLSLSVSDPVCGDLVLRAISSGNSKIPSSPSDRWVQS